MKGLVAVYAMFAAGFAIAIGNHEASLWATLWKAALFPGIAGYDLAMRLFNYH